MSLLHSMLVSKTSEMPLLYSEFREDGIVVIIFGSMTPLYTFQMQDVEACFLDVIPQTNQPLRLLYDFRQVEPIQRQAVERLKPIFGILSDHPKTRSAFLIEDPQQYLMVYEACVMLGNAQLGKAEAFQREDSAIAWLLEP